MSGLVLAVVATLTALSAPALAAPAEDRACLSKAEQKAALSSWPNGYAGGGNSLGSRFGAWTRCPGGRQGPPLP